MSLASLRALLIEHGEELSASWLESHLASSVVSADEAPIRGAHRRASSLLSALSGVLATADPGDWGSFAHRETVQLVALMSHSLAENGATASAAGALLPSLGLALERAGASAVGELVLPLATVACETYTAARLASLERRHQASLVEHCPMLRLRPDLLLLAPSGELGHDAAVAIVDRAIRAVHDLEVSSPTLVLDLGHLSSACSGQTIGALLSLSEELDALGGSMSVVGVSAAQAASLERAGVDLGRVSRWPSLAEGLSSEGPPGLFRKILKLFV